MTTLKQGIVNGLKDAYCSGIGQDPQLLANLRRVLLGGQQAAPPLNALNRWICDKDPAASDFTSPFPGGQCCDSRYRVFTQGVNSLGQPDARESAPPAGRILGLRRGINNLGFPSVWVQSQDCQGVVREEFILAVNTVEQRDSWVIVDTEVIEGSDNCGDPDPPGPTEPGPISLDIDVTYGPNNEFSLVVPIVFAPFYISVDGRLLADVDIALPDLNLTGTLELFPDFELDVDLNFGRNPNDDGPVGPEPPDTPPADPDDVTEPAGEDDEGPTPPIFAVLTAAVIEPETRASGIFQPIGPDIYAPRIGSIRFGTVVDGAVYWSPDIDVKGLRQVTPCPFPWGATLVTVNPIDGVGLNWAPIRTERPEWPPFLQLGEQTTIDRRDD